MVMTSSPSPMPSDRDAQVQAAGAAVDADAVLAGPARAAQAASKASMRGPMLSRSRAEDLHDGLDLVVGDAGVRQRNRFIGHGCFPYTNASRLERICRRHCNIFVGLHSVLVMSFLVGPPNCPGSAGAAAACLAGLAWVFSGPARRDKIRPGLHIVVNGTAAMDTKALETRLFVGGRLCLFGEHSDWAAEYGRHKGYCLVIGTDQGLTAVAQPVGRVRRRDADCPTAWAGPAAGAGR